MKLLLENWKRFLLNENLLAPYESDLEYAEDGKLILYHVSSTSDIETLDPAVAAQSTKSYTKAEYRTWDRPRGALSHYARPVETLISRQAGRI